MAMPQDIVLHNLTVGIQINDEFRSHTYTHT